MMKKNYVDVKVVANGETRKAAFAKGINRDVNLDNVQKIKAMIKTKGYRKAEAIHVVKAEEVLKSGDITLVDINGEVISKEDAKNYFLILDGQHRAKATSRYNEWAEEEGEEIIQVPAIIVELHGETVAGYINDINITKKVWDIVDYVRGAANINSDDKFLQRYSELIKSEQNPKGYSISTLNLIFCSNSKAISKSDFSLLCSGEEHKGKKVKKPIIPAHNLEMGDKFIQICKEKGFDESSISKRYLIKQFNDIKISTSSTDKAFDAFQSITVNDKAAMLNSKNHLDENLVIQQFKLIIERMNTDKITEDLSSLKSVK